MLVEGRKMATGTKLKRGGRRREKEGRGRLPWGGEQLQRFFKKLCERTREKEKMGLTAPLLKGEEATTLCIY